MLTRAAATPERLSWIALASVPVPDGSAWNWYGIFLALAVFSMPAPTTGLMFGPRQRIGPPPIFTSPSFRLSFSTLG